MFRSYQIQTNRSSQDMYIHEKYMRFMYSTTCTCTSAGWFHVIQYHYGYDKKSPAAAVVAGDRRLDLTQRPRSPWRHQRHRRRHRKCRHVSSPDGAVARRAAGSCPDSADTCASWSRPSGDAACGCAAPPPSRNICTQCIGIDGSRRTTLTVYTDFVSIVRDLCNNQCFA